MSQGMLFYQSIIWELSSLPIFAIHIFNLSDLIFYNPDISNQSFQSSIFPIFPIYISDLTDPLSTLSSGPLFDIYLAGSDVL